MITGAANGASQNPAYRPSPAFLDPVVKLDQTLKRIKRCIIRGHPAVLKQRSEGMGPGDSTVSHMREPKDQPADGSTEGDRSRRESRGSQPPPGSLSRLRRKFSGRKISRPPVGWRNASCQNRVAAGTFVRFVNNVPHPGNGEGLQEGALWQKSEMSGTCQALTGFTGRGGLRGRCER